MSRQSGFTVEENYGNIKVSTVTEGTLSLDDTRQGPVCGSATANLTDGPVHRQPQPGDALRRLGKEDEKRNGTERPDHNYNLLRDVQFYHCCGLHAKREKMKRKIYIVFFILISIATPLFSVNWNLILDRQVSTNRYGYDFNGQKGIQDEELVPDTDGNKVVADTEIPDVIDFMIDKSQTLSQIKDIQSFMKTSLPFLDNQIEFTSQITAIKRSNISELQLLLLQYQNLLEESTGQDQLDRLARLIALRGCQVALSEGRLYLPDGRIVIGQHVGTGRRILSNSLNEVRYNWQLTEDYRIDLSTGHFYIEEGSKIRFSCIDNSMDFISSIGDNPFYDENGNRIGFIDSDPYSTLNFDVIFDEPEKIELSGNTYDGVSSIKYSTGGRIVSIIAEKATILDGTTVNNVEVRFYPDVTINYIETEGSFYYELNGQNLELKFLGLYADGSPWRLNSLDDMDLFYNDQSFETDGFTRVDFYPDGSLKQVFGTFRLSLQFNLNQLDSSLIRRMDINPDSSLSFLQFYGYENIMAPVLGRVRANTIHFAAQSMPEIISFSEEGNKPRKIQLSEGTSFFIEEGVIAFHNSTLTYLSSAYSPYVIDLPGDLVLMVEDQGERAELDYYDSGSLRKLRLEDGYVELELKDGNFVTTDSVKFHENGAIKEIFFSSQREVIFPLLGTVSCERIKYDSGGDLMEIVGGTFKYEIFGQNVELYDVSFYEGQRIDKASLSNEINIELLSGDIVSCDGRFHLYPDGCIKQIVGVSKDMKLHLPDGSSINIYEDRAINIDFHNNGSVNRVVGLKEPYTITFSNGATATAYYMLEYDEQGNILSFY
jgi:hypothetical protein